MKLRWCVLFVDENKPDAEALICTDENSQTIFDEKQQAIDLMIFMRKNRTSRNYVLCTLVEDNTL
jgi:hypothetical protein